MKKQKQAAGNHPSQPDRNPGHQPDAGDRSEQTRQTRTRPAAQADEVGWPLPSSAAGAVDGTSEHPPISDAVAADITSIVESACQTVRLTEQQKCELRQCFSILLTPESSPLCKGRALLHIIEHKLMPSWPDVVENNLPLFKLSLSGVRKLVRLARENRDQNGGNPSFADGDSRVSAPSIRNALPASPANAAGVEDANETASPSGGGVAAPGEGARHDGDSASKQPPASPPEAAAGDERNAPPAPIAAPEKKRARTKKPKATEVAEPQAGEPVQDLALPSVETTQPDPAEAALAPTGPVEQASAGAGTASLPETDPAAVPVGKLISIPPMLLADLTEDDWVSRINEGVGEGIRRFINVGADLLAAKKAVGHGRWIEMFKSGRIKMSLSTATMLMRVAEHAALSNSQHLANLPPSLTTLRVLAEGTVEVIETGIKDGKINPALTAKQAQDFVRVHCPRPVVKSAGKQCEADTPCPPSRTETADLAKSPTEAVMNGAGDTSDNPPSALTPTEAAPSQPEPSHDEAPALGGPPELDLEIEWPPIEASLDGLLQRCHPDKQQEFWAKLDGFVCRHIEPAPLYKRRGTA